MNVQKSCLMLINRCANAIVPVSQFSVEIARTLYLPLQYPPKLLLPVEYELVAIIEMIVDRALLSTRKVLISGISIRHMILAWWRSHT